MFAGDPAVAFDQFSGPEPEPINAISDYGQGWRCWAHPYGQAVRDHYMKRAYT
jgi:hypothetical protein